MAEWLRIALTMSIMGFAVVAYFATAESALRDLTTTMGDLLRGQRADTGRPAPEPVPAEATVHGVTGS